MKAVQFENEVYEGQINAVLYLSNIDELPSWPWKDV